MTKSFKWIWRCFKNRLKETSTWLGMLLFLFGFIHGSEIEMIIGLLAIFVPETFWDDFFAKRGSEVLSGLNDNETDKPQ